MVFESCPSAIQPVAIENKTLVSTVETKDYDVRIEISLRYKDGEAFKACVHGAELLGEMANQLVKKTKE